MSCFWKRPAAERGQAFVEMAISLVFLLILLSVTIEAGWALYTMIALRDAAQEAASYAAICPVPGVSNDYPKVISRLRTSASAPINMADVSDIRVCVINPASPPTSCAAQALLSPALGLDIRVEAAVNHQILAPFVGSFIGTNTIPIRVDVSDAILRLSTTDCQ